MDKNCRAFLPQGAIHLLHFRYFCRKGMGYETVTFVRNIDWL